MVRVRAKLRAKAYFKLTRPLRRHKVRERRAWEEAGYKVKGAIVFPPWEQTYPGKKGRGKVPKGEPVWYARW